MINLRILAGAGAAIAMALVAGGASAAVRFQDGWQLQSGGITNIWETTNETHEFNISLDAFPTPAGFHSATVYLTEGGSGFSDAFTLTTDGANPGHVDAYFISDGASALEQAAMKYSTNAFHIRETGNWQDVSSYFGQSAGFAKIVSDVPEPTTWAMMILGLGGVGASMRLARRRSAAMAAA